MQKQVVHPTERRPFMESLEPRVLLSAAGAGDGAGGLTDYTVWWRYEETSGPTAHDESANGFNATVSGATWTSGDHGNALSFDNIADYVDNDTSNVISELTTHSQGSISVWFKINTLPTGGAVHSVFYIGNDQGSTTDSFHIEVGHFNDSQQRRLYFTFIKNGSVVMCYDSSGFLLLDTDTWYHFVGVVGADYNTGFLNGEEMIGRHYNVGTTSSAHYWFSDLSSPTFCYTGRGVLGKQSHWNYFDGMIDEVRIYDRALNASEVPQLYLGSPPAPPNVTGVVRGGDPDELPDLAFTFSKDVGNTIDVGDLTLYNDTTGAPVGTTGAIVSYNAGTDTATWDLSSLGLPAAYYTATLAATGITDCLGKQLDGDADGMGGDDHVVSDLLVALGGDANLDGSVNVGDLGILGANYDQSGKDWGTGDFNGDGDVNVGDLGILGANYESSVVPGGGSQDSSQTSQQEGPGGTGLPLNLLEARSPDDAGGEVDLLGVVRAVGTPHAGTLPVSRLEKGTTNHRAIRSPTTISTLNQPSYGDELIDILSIPKL